MKSVTLIIFGLVLAIHCANGVNIFEQVKRNIATVKQNINKAVDKINKEVDQTIDRHQKFLKSNRDLALNLAKLDITTKITLINNAAEKNKDCLKEYQNEINGAQSKCYNDVSSCFDEAEDNMKNLKNDILPSITSIKGLSMEIDRGVINCVGASDPTNYMICVTKVLAQVNISLRAAESQSLPIVQQIPIKARAIIDSATSCGKDKASIISMRLQLIRDNVKNCAESN